jgi:heme exporter protein A
MSNADPILDARDLTVWRGERCLFSALGLGVGAGQMLWLRGANGAGKTTLLRVLAGLGHADGGAVTRRADVELMYLGHLDALKRELTPREDLRAWCALQGASADATGIDAALDALGVAAAGDLPIASLSAGQRRRVALARLELSRAALWLLDEPATNLDEQGERAVATAIDAQLARGGAVVAASHHAFGLRGRIAELTLGRTA